MNKTQIHTEIVGHSLSPQGDELISVLCTFPRIILAEINTHRMLSKNTSSSRAIPFKKMVEAIENDPFIPIAWQKHHSGMQGNEYLVHPLEIKEAQQMWKRSLDYALASAKDVYKTGVTKQLCNRLLEPFMWTTMLITGSKEGWDNFFNLRLPEYYLENIPIVNEDLSLSSKTITLIGKSKKELLKEINQIDNDSYNDFKTIINNYSDLDWLKLNKGQAEIHMMALAEKIYDAIQESVPIQLKPNEWHIPMISDLESLKLSTDDQIKLSVGRAANTSYTVVGDGKELTLEQAIKIHDKCKELNHSSVFEHCARAMSEVEYTSSKSTGYTRKGEDQYGWCNNFKGFIPYRYMIDNNLI